MNLSMSFLPSPLQRQDSSNERVRRLQSDKDALQLQVQILTEQINAQSDKLKDLEMTVNEKNLLLNNSEDLLNRVFTFPTTYLNHHNCFSSSYFRKCFHVRLLRHRNLN